MNNIFKKTATGIKFSWDILELEKQFIGELMDGTDINGRYVSFSDPLKRPHWQRFPRGILFARNFSINFPKECLEVANAIYKIQTELKKEESDDELSKIFLSHKINPASVNIIKIIAGNTVPAHDDVTRALSLNIGLINSNSCETQIINTTDNLNFDHHDIKSFIMNDGDAYLLKVSNSHRINSLVTNDSGLDRYIISYTIAVGGHHVMP